MSILDDLHAEMNDKLLHLRGKIGGFEGDLVEARAKLTDRQRKFCDLCGGDLPAYG